MCVRGKEGEYKMLRFLTVGIVMHSMMFSSPYGPCGGDGLQLNA